jgi:O-antigen ligase
MFFLSDGPDRAMNWMPGLHFWLTISVAMLAPLPYGSAEPIWIAIWVLILAAVLALAPGHALNARQGRMIGWIIGLWLAYLCAALLQVLPDPPFLAHEAWQAANDTPGASTPTRISVRATIPTETLGRTLLTILAFCNGFVVGAQEERAKRLLDGLAYAGLLVALYAIFAELLIPARLLVRTKTSYFGDMTGTFVNRNTAATFFGVITILWLFSVLRILGRIRLYPGRLLLIVPQNEAAVRSLAFRIVALAICAMALLGTHSRGGALALGIGLAVSTSIILIDRGKALLSLVLSGVVVIVYWLGGTIGARVESEGIFDGGRWTTYLSSWELVTQHPWLGTGLGTFRDVFPAVRSRSAFASGVWDKAHDTIVEIAVEMGLPLAAAIILAALWIVFSIYRAAVSSKGRRRADLFALASIAVLAFAHSLMDFSLQIPGFLTPFAILLGAGSALSRAANDEEFERPAEPDASGVSRHSGKNGRNQRHIPLAGFRKGFGGGSPTLRRSISAKEAERERERALL